MGRDFPGFSLPVAGQGNRIWRQHVFSPLPSGRGGDPSPRRWEGEGGLPPPVFLQATTRKRLVPLTPPRLWRGALPPPLEARGGRAQGIQKPSYDTLRIWRG